MIFRIALAAAFSCATAAQAETIKIPRDLHGSAMNRRGGQEIVVNAARDVVEIHQMVNGKQAVWRLANGVTGHMLQGALGADCPPATQYVRLTATRLEFGWDAPSLAQRSDDWIDIKCLHDGAVCHRHPRFAPSAGTVARGGT